MPLEYDSKAAIRKMGDDEYELIWITNSLILSVLTEQQMLELRDAIDRMTTLPPGETHIYFFPIMRHKVTG
jgi:hypothetical protein